MSRTLALFLAPALALALASLAAACGTSSEAAPPTKQAAPAADACTEVMTRNRSCTDDFIPALVDARARADKPAGIRDQVAKDRDGVIAQAKTEWATDSTDENIARMCVSVAADLAPADQAAARACLAKQACGEFVACVSPIFEKHLSK